METAKHIPEEEIKIPIKLVDYSAWIASSRRQTIYDEVMKLSREDRVKLSAYPSTESYWFNPYGASNTTVKEVASHPVSWWEGLTHDEKSFYRAACVLQEQVVGVTTGAQRDAGLANFYDKVTRGNALAWYAICPSHLRVKIDKTVEARLNVRVVTRSYDEQTWDEVAYELGDRPKVLYFVDEGETMVQSHFQCAVYQRWCVRYQEEALKTEIVKFAPIAQEERRAFNKTLGLDNAEGLPNQAEGLDPVQSATVRWLQATGEMPIEFMANTYRDQDAKMSDRIAAARTLMDYVHRRVPLVQKVEQDINMTPKLDTNVLKGLSEKELDTLEKLLKKMGTEL